MKEAHNAREIIEQEYSEFLKTILHTELYRACTRIDGRSIKQSFKALALARVEKVESKPLKGALEQMAPSMFPEAEVVRTHPCAGRMQSVLVKTFRVKGA